MSELPEARPFAGGRRLMATALVVGLVGSASTVIGLVLAPGQTWFSYLIAVVYALSLALGLVAFLIIVHCMNATWPTVVRRLAESGAAVLPLLALLFVPILFALRYLYPWMHVGAFGD